MADELENNAPTVLNPAEMESAAEIMGLHPSLMRDAFGRAAEAYERIYGPTRREFSDDQYEELISLTSRFQQATTPSFQPAPAGGAIPGNEFSLSVRGLQQGVSDLITGLQQARRQKELFGDPQQRSRITGQVANLRAQADLLRDRAGQLRAGKPVEEMYAFIPDDGSPVNHERIAESMSAEADRMMSDAQALEETLQEHMGVVDRMGRLEMDRERGEADDNFQREFVRVFGQRAYDNTVSAMQQTAKDQAAAGREAFTQQELWRRMVFREQQATNRAIINAQSRAANQRRQPGAELMPFGLNPNTTKNFIRSYRGDVKKAYDDFVKDATLDGSLRREDLPSEQKLIMERMETQMRYLDQIELSADFWRTERVDELPEKYYPTDDQVQQLTEMRSSGVPDYAIQAWMEYERISFDAAPSMPGAAAPSLSSSWATVPMPDRPAVTPPQQLPAEQLREPQPFARRQPTRPPAPLPAIGSGAQRQPDEARKPSPEADPQPERTELSTADERSFQAWYQQWAEKTGIDPDPDNPLHQYDYRAAFKAGATPELDPSDGQWHWPSRFKDDDHPNRFVDGVDTKAFDQTATR